MLPPLQILVLHILTQQLRFAPAAGGDNLFLLSLHLPCRVSLLMHPARTKVCLNEHSSINLMHSAVASPHEILTALTQPSGWVSPLKLSLFNSLVMFPSCQPDGMVLPSLAMRRDQVLLNRFIPCLSCKNLGYKTATTQTCLSPASQLPAVLVRGRVKCMNDIWPIYCQMNFQLSVHPAAPSLALKCPDRCWNPGLAYGTWVWACMTLTFPCLLCNTSPSCCCYQKKQSQGLLLQQISGGKQPIDKWCQVSQSSSVFCFAQLCYQLSVVSGFLIIRLLQRP